MDFLLQYGYLGIILFLVLTGCGMPIPEEVAIIFAGWGSSQGHLDPRFAVAACLFGALLGDSIMYSIGYHFGHSLVSEHPKLAKFVGAEREEQFERAILRHGFKIMLLARFMVGVRGPVYVAAGVVRMPFRRFLLWDLICASLVVATFFGLSYVYGEQITGLVRDAETKLTLIVGLAGLVFALWWLRRRKKEVLDQAIDQGAEHGPLTQVAPPSEQASPQQANAKLESSNEDVA
ncbi:MAG: DedA family protein [Planctomycetota bacterium]